MPGGFLGAWETVRASRLNSAVSPRTFSFPAEGGAGLGFVVMSFSL